MIAFPNPWYLASNVEAIWPRLKPAHREYFVKANKKERARMEAKTAVGEAMREASLNAKATEARRATFAKGLYKWLDAKGQKIPATEAGIKRHYARVKLYVQMFGPLTPASQREYDRKYAAIRAGIAREKQRVVDQANARMAAQERARIAKANADAARAAAAKARAARADARQRRDAQRARALIPQQIAMREGQIARYAKRLATDQAQLVEVQDKMVTYEGTPHYQKFKKMEYTLAPRIGWWQNALAYYQTKLDDLLERQELLQAMLKEN